MNQFPISLIFFQLSLVLVDLSSANFWIVFPLHCLCHHTSLTSSIYKQHCDFIFGPNLVLSNFEGWRFLFFIYIYIILEGKGYGSGWQSHIIILLYLGLGVRTSCCLRVKNYPGRRIKGPAESNQRRGRSFKTLGNVVRKNSFFWTN